MQAIRALLEPQTNDVNSRPAICKLLGKSTTLSVKSDRGIKIADWIMPPTRIVNRPVTEAIMVSRAFK